MQSLPEFGPKITLVFSDGKKDEISSYILAVISPVLKMILERDRPSTIYIQASYESWTRVLANVKLFANSAQEDDNVIRALDEKAMVEDLCTANFYAIASAIHIYIKAFESLPITRDRGSHVLELLSLGLDLKLEKYEECLWNGKNVPNLTAKQFYFYYTDKDWNSDLDAKKQAMAEKWARHQSQNNLCQLWNLTKETHDTILFIILCHHITDPDLQKEIRQHIVNSYSDLCAHCQQYVCDTCESCNERHCNECGDCN